MTNDICILMDPDLTFVKYSIEKTMAYGRVGTKDVDQRNLQLSYDILSTTTEYTVLKPEEIFDIIQQSKPTQSAMYRNGTTSERIVKATEAAILKKLGIISCLN